MRTAIDTNVLSSILSNEPSAGPAVQRLNAAKREGALLLSPVVYSELLAYPGATPAFIDAFLRDTSIAVEFAQSQELWLEAGTRFARYARSRRSAHGQPRRLLADFLIGAHALLQADRLITLDPRRYRQDFPELRILSL